MVTPELFPTDWASAVVLVPHPDDPEYLSAAVAKWTAAGRHVTYILGCRGEAGIEGMATEQAGPLREDEQRRAAAIAGVEDVRFWDEPDSNIRNTAALRDKIAETLTVSKPDLVVTVFGGAEWAPGAPNQRDHIEFAAAVEQAYDEMTLPPRWLFAAAPPPTHVEVVDEFVDVAVESFAAHERYLMALDAHTPALEQARQQLEMALPVRGDIGNHRVAQFVKLRG
ncbi:PIG-L family deacetylase [Rhodococcus sp. NPDC049939]|uniref:PIG-L deacetylase family protein n=1 Tax=Rhodococcus sp. NPDC049939 TaxID=3155511 RepID=UPI0033E9A024